MNIQEARRRDRVDIFLKKSCSLLLFACGARERRSQVTSSYARCPCREAQKALQRRETTVVRSTLSAQGHRKGGSIDIVRSLTTTNRRLGTRAAGTNQVPLGYSACSLPSPSFWAVPVAVLPQQSGRCFQTRFRLLASCMFISN